MKNLFKRIRNTITGRFAKKSEALLNPATTVSETVRPSWEHALKTLQRADPDSPSVIPTAAMAAGMTTGAYVDALKAGTVSPKLFDIHLMHGRRIWKGEVPSRQMTMDEVEAYDRFIASHRAAQDLPQ